jgi:hydrogenase maturation protease
MRQKADYEDRILLMGIGNYPMGDEGVGVHLAQRLAKLMLPPNVDVVGGGSGGSHLMEYFENYPEVILVDASTDNDPPGTIRLVKPKFAEDFPVTMSTHDAGLKDMVGALHLLDNPPEIYLLVVSIAPVQQPGNSLSAEIEAAMPSLFEKVTELIGSITEKELDWATP